MPVAAIVRASAALVVSRSIRSSVSSETCGRPSSSAARVAERAASTRGRKVASQCESGFEPSMRPANRSGVPAALITSTAHASATSGTSRSTSRSTPSPGHAPCATRDTASSSSGSRASTCSPRAGPRTPGVANVIESSVPPPGASRMSTWAASRPIVGSPSPSPGLSARGCIPRPLSATTTVSSSAAVEMVTCTRPGSRSMNAWMTELVTASVTARVRSTTSSGVAPCSCANARTRPRASVTLAGSAGSSQSSRAATAGIGARFYEVSRATRRS